MTTRAGRSAYAFIDHPDGFVIVGWQNAVRVRLRDTHWVLERRDRSLDIPLFSFGLVLATIVNMFCEQRYWVMRRLDKGDRTKDELCCSIKRDTHRLHRELGKRVYRRLRRLLRQSDPVMLAVHRANSSSLAGGMALAVQGYAGEGRIPMSAIIRDPDVLTYRAAAIAAGHLPDLIALPSLSEREATAA